MTRKNESKIIYKVKEAKVKTPFLLDDYPEEIQGFFGKKRVITTELDPSQPNSKLNPEMMDHVLYMIKESNKCAEKRAREGKIQNNVKFGIIYPYEKDREGNLEESTDRIVFNFTEYPIPPKRTILMSFWEVNENTGLRDLSDWFLTKGYPYGVTYNKEQCK